MAFPALSRESVLVGAAAIGAALAVGFLAGRRYHSELLDFGTSSNSRSLLQGNSHLHKYVLDHSIREHPLLKKLRLVASALPDKQLWVSCDQAQFVANLIRVIGAKKVIEIGVSAGYNTLNIALVLPEDGKIVACDINEDLANTGKPLWKEARVLHKIDLRIKPAIETLDELLANGETGTFDLAFIHADEESYDDYYEKCLRLVRKGRILVLDNVLLSGRVLKPGKSDHTAEHIHQLNEKIFRDPRVNITQNSSSPKLDGRVTSPRILALLQLPAERRCPDLWLCKLLPTYGLTWVPISQQKKHPSTKVLPWEWIGSLCTIWELCQVF